MVTVKLLAYCVDTGLCRDCKNIQVMIISLCHCSAYVVTQTIDASGLFSLCLEHCLILQQRYSLIYSDLCMHQSTVL